MIWDAMHRQIPGKALCQVVTAKKCNMSKWKQVTQELTSLRHSHKWSQLLLLFLETWNSSLHLTGKHDPRIGGVCISDEMNIVLMSKEQYGKILEEIKISNATTIREEIIRVREAMIELYGLGHYPKSPIILDPMNLINSAEKNVMLQLYSSSKRINETNRQRTVTIIDTTVYA